MSQKGGLFLTVIMPDVTMEQTEKIDDQVLTPEMVEMGQELGDVDSDVLEEFVVDRKKIETPVLRRSGRAAGKPSWLTKGYVVKRLEVED